MAAEPVVTRVSYQSPKAKASAAYQAQRRELRRVENESTAHAKAAKKKNDARASLGTTAKLVPGKHKMVGGQNAAGGGVLTGQLFDRNGKPLD